MQVKLYTTSSLCNEIEQNKELLNQNSNQIKTPNWENKNLPK